MGGGPNACITEIRWRWGVEAEKFVDKMDLGGDPLIGGLTKGWSEWEQCTVLVLPIYLCSGVGGSIW